MRVLRQRGERGQKRPRNLKSWAWQFAVCQRKGVRSNPGESCVTKSKGGPVSKGCWSTAFMLLKGQMRTKEVLGKTEQITGQVR